MRTDEFSYYLPEELIAQVPQPRGQSRLLTLDRKSGQQAYRNFSDLPGMLLPGDTLVINDSRVSARRFEARRSSGQAAELLLLRPQAELEWEALVYPGKRLKPGAELTIILSDDQVVHAEVVSTTEEGGRILRFANSAIRDRLAQEGVTPLPPYIHSRLEDEQRYQTVYAGENGSSAAPTAGLHFTEDMLQSIQNAGIAIARITLHVGVDTFRPVKVENLEEHRMHGEWFTISTADTERINATSGRVIAIGTTSVRALESAATGKRHVKSGAMETRLFITPGYQFQVVDGILTNFHLPESTLIMLISAFAGKENILAAYRAAVEARFRFFSFGDAMFII